MRPIATATILLLTLAALLAGCHSQAIDRFADQELAEIDRDEATSTVTPTCPDGAPFGPGCGLIADLMGTSKFRRQFRDSYCGGLEDAACQSLYERMFQANLRKRYDAADYELVSMHCDAEPRTCSEPADFERRLLISHNDEVGARAVNRRIEVVDRRREAQKNRVQHQWEVVGEVAYVLSDGPKCRSFPSVFGGVTNTICVEGATTK